METQRSSIPLLVVLISSWKKEHLKRWLILIIDEYWLNKMKADKKSKTSLDMLSVNEVKIGACHPV